MYNLGGLIKDCLGIVLIEDGIFCGVIMNMIMIIELIVGNIGIGVVLVVVKYCFKIILVVLEYFSFEKQILMKVFGVEVINMLDEGGMIGVIVKVLELVVSIVDFYVFNQFVNFDNLWVYEWMLGLEIISDLNG